MTMLSPRASHHGYPYRDTLAHELTHLAITRVTHDHAPLWMQEGLAKHEETRWRPPGPFDGPARAPEAMVLEGIEKKLDLPLDKLGMSLAMLPSPEAAIVAYAEVTSFVRRLAAHEPDGGRASLDPDGDGAHARRERGAEGGDGHGPAAWDKAWRAWLAEQPKEKLRRSSGSSRSTRIFAKIRDQRAPRRAPPRAQVTPRPRSSMLAKVKDERIRRSGAPVAQRAHARSRPGRRGGRRARRGSEGHDRRSYGPWWALRGVLRPRRGATGPSPEPERSRRRSRSIRSVWRPHGERLDAARAPWRAPLQLRSSPSFGEALRGRAAWNFAP